MKRHRGTVRTRTQTAIEQTEARAGFQSPARTNSTGFAMVDITRGKDHRVMHIIELMQRDEYASMETCKRLSEEWSMALATVCSMAAEAGRVLRFVGQPQATADWCMAQLRLLIASTDSDIAKIAAIRVLLERQPRSHNPNERPVIIPRDEQIEMLMRELAEPGPEMAEALRRMGVQLPLRPVVDVAS